MCNGALAAMYSVIVEAAFSARHSVRLPDGICEPPHDHPWRVRACFSAAELDAHGMVVDFVQARTALEAIAGRLHECDLNTHPALAGKTPTAEVVASYICAELIEAGLTQTRAVAVTESPACVAVYERPGAGKCRTAPWFDDV